MTNDLDEFERGVCRLARNLDVKIDKLDKTGNSLWLTVSTVSPKRKKIDASNKKVARKKATKKKLAKTTAAKKKVSRKKVAKKKATRVTATKSKVKSETKTSLKKKSIAQQRKDMKAKDSSYNNTFGRHPRGSYWRG